MKISSSHSWHNFHQLLRKREPSFWTETVMGPSLPLKEGYFREGMLAYPTLGCPYHARTNCTHRPLPPCQVCQS